MLKPSEQTPAFSKLIAELVPKYLDPELYHVINGGVPETTKVIWVVFPCVLSVLTAVVDLGVAVGSQ